MAQHVRKGLALNGHAELAGPGEIGLHGLAGPMGLGEEDFFVRSCKSAPEITAIVPCGLPRTMTADKGFTSLRVEVGDRFRIEVAGDFSPVVFAKLVRTLEELR